MKKNLALKHLLLREARDLVHRDEERGDSEGAHRAAKLLELIDTLEVDEKSDERGSGGGSKSFVIRAKTADAAPRIQVDETWFKFYGRSEEANPSEPTHGPDPTRVPDNSMNARELWDRMLRMSGVSAGLGQNKRGASINKVERMFDLDGRPEATVVRRTKAPFNRVLGGVGLALLGSVFVGLGQGEPLTGSVPSSGVQVGVLFGTLFVTVTGILWRTGSPFGVSALIAGAGAVYVYLSPQPVLIECRVAALASFLMMLQLESARAVFWPLLIGAAVGAPVWWGGTQGIAVVLLGVGVFNLSHLIAPWVFSKARWVLFHVGVLGSVGLWMFLLRASGGWSAGWGAWSLNAAQLPRIVDFARDSAQEFTRMGQAIIGLVALGYWFVGTHRSALHLLLPVYLFVLSWITGGTELELPIAAGLLARWLSYMVRVEPPYGHNVGSNAASAGSNARAELGGHGE